MSDFLDFSEYAKDQTEKLESPIEDQLRKYEKEEQNPTDTDLYEFTDSITQLEREEKISGDEALQKGRGRSFYGNEDLEGLTKTPNMADEIQKRTNAELMARQLGADYDFIYENYNALASGFTGSQDVKEQYKWFKDSFESGKALNNASKAFADYVLTGDEKHIERALSYAEEVKDIPFAPNKMKYFLSLATQQLPMMGEMMGTGAALGGASGAAAWALGTFLGSSNPMGMAATAAKIMFTVGSGAKGWEQFAGEFGLSMYMELKENGYEVNHTALRTISSVIGAAGAAIETLQVGEILKATPGLKKMVVASLSDRLAKFLASSGAKIARKGLKKALPRAVATGALGTVTRLGAVMASNALEESFQEMTKELGREIYAGLNDVNKVSRAYAYEQLKKENPQKIPTPEEIDAYVENNEHSRLPKRQARELWEQFYTSAYMGAILGGVLSFGGSTLTGIKQGTAEYRYAEAYVGEIVSDIVRNNTDPDTIYSEIKNSKEIQQFIGKKKTERKAAVERDIEYEAFLGKSERDILERQIGSDEYYRSPDGTFYNVYGDEVKSVPDDAFVIEFAYDSDGVLVDDFGVKYNHAPWSDVYKENSQKSDSLAVNYNPEKGVYVDLKGREYSEVPENAKIVNKWDSFDPLTGIATLEGGDQVKTLKKPWEQRNVLDTLRTNIDPLKMIEMGEEEARVFYKMDMESSRVEGRQAPPPFESWIRQNRINLYRKKGNMFEVKYDQHLKNYQHVKDYAENLMNSLNEEERSFFGPVLEKVQEVYKAMGEGKNAVTTLEQSLGRFSRRMDSIETSIRAIRARMRNTKDTALKNKMFDEVKSLRTQLFKELREKNLFEKLFVDTHRKMATANWQMLQQRDFLEKLSEKQSEYESPEVQDLIRGRKPIMDLFLKMDVERGLLEEGYETHDYDYIRNLGERATQDPELFRERMANRDVGISVEDIAKVAREGYYGGYMRERWNSMLNRMERGNKKRLAKLVSDKVSRVFKEPPNTVHRDERTRILALQQMIDPNFRNAEKVEEHQQVKDYQKLIEKIRKSPDANRDAVIDAALEAARKPLNEMTLQQLDDIEYGIMMLSSIGKARRSAELLQRDMEAKTMVDLAADTVSNIDWAHLEKSIDTKEYQDILRDKGIKKLTKNVMSFFLDPADIFDALDGHQNRQGPWVEMFVDRSNEAKAKSLEQIHTRRNKVQEVMKNNNVPVDRMDKWIDVNGNQITVQTAMTYYAAVGAPGRHSGNEHLRDLLKNPDGNNASEQFMDAAVAALTSEDLNVADAILEDYYNIHSRLSEAFAVLENKQLGLEPNYVPILLKWMDGSENIEEVLWAETFYGDKKFEESIDSFFTNPRSKEIRNKSMAVNTDMFGVWSSMVEKHEQYINFSEVASLYKRVIKDPVFRKSIKSRMGSQWLQTIDNYVKSQVNPFWWKHYSWHDNLFRAVKRNAAVTFLGGRIQTMLKQIPSAIFYARNSGTRYFLGAIGQWLKNPNEFYKEAGDLDPLLKYSTHEIESVWYKKKFESAFKKKAQNIGEISMKGILTFDRWVKTIGQTAVLHRMMDSGMSKAKAVATARKVTQRTQPTGDPRMIANIYKSNEAIRTALVFSQQLMKIFNMATYDTWSAAKNGQINEALKTHFAINLSAVMIMAAQHKRLPEDGEELLQWYRDYVIGIVPIVGKTMVSAMNGWEPVTIPTQMVMNTVDIFTKEWDADSLNYQFKNVLENIGLTMSLPTGIIGEIMDSIGAYKNDGVGEAILELMGGQSDRE